jgi:chemotaxis protein MotB
MRNSRMFLALLVAAAVMTMGGCKNSLKQEKAMLEQENESLKNQLADRNKALEDCNAELRAREQQLSQLRRGEGGGERRTGFEGIPGVTGSIGAGEVTASVSSDLLFDSGKATLKASAKKSLDQVASVLNSTYSGKSIRVAGHTDTDPIKKSGYKSNDHLGFERAYAVKEYLISKGVDPKRLYLASYGPNVPRGNKAQSRRVEIVVLMSGA